MDKKIKIAVIEDDTVMLRALKVELSSNFEVVSTMDGSEAISLINKSKPDLILLDIVLPGIDGFTILKQLKEKSDTKDVPVIILTNLGQDGDRKKGFDLGAIGYFVKSSMNLEDISKKITQALA